MNEFLVCAFDICSKYPLVIPLKDIKVITITNVFSKNSRWIKAQTK